MFVTAVYTDAMHSPIILQVHTTAKLLSAGDSIDRVHLRVHHRHQGSFPLKLLLLMPMMPHSTSSRPGAASTESKCRSTVPSRPIFAMPS